MNGAENLRGIDYQISYALFHLLQCLVTDEALPARIALEDLDDEGADMILGWEQRPELRIQVKKLSEGYQWTIGRLTDVIRKFCNSGEASTYMFVTNGQANRDVTALKKAIREGTEISEEAMDTFVSEECSHTRISKTLTRTKIWTRCYPSDDDDDPAQGLRREVERVLAHQRFRIAKPLQDATQELWNAVFEMARSGRTVSGDFVLEQFAACGLLLSTTTWARYPVVNQYYAHSISVDAMLETIENSSLILVTGIGGSGKTVLAAEASSRSSAEGGPVCWIDTNALLDPESLVEAVAAYVADLGLDTDARRLRDTPRLERPSEIARIVQANALRVVIDRVDRASEKVSAFLELIVRSCSVADAGLFMLTSRSIPNWWDEAAAMREHVSIVRLHGLPLQSAVNLIMDADLGLSEEECKHLSERVDGHPQSLTLLCNATDASTEIDEALAAESVRAWILGRVLEELPSDVLTALSSLSIYDYPLVRSEAHSAIGANGPILLEALLRRDLIKTIEDEIVMHDVIRDAAEALLEPARRNTLHSEAARRVFTEIESDYITADFVLFEKSTKWAMHLEKLLDTTLLDDKQRTILSLEPNQLRDLFEINDRGFPFEFEDASLERTWDAVRQLEERDLVEPWVIDGDRSPNQKEFKLKQFSFYDRLLVQSICLLHAYSGSIGFVPILQFNHAYKLQWLICPWEHCIELFPLAKERHPGSCPVFGHDCPGGVEQANRCRDADGCEWDKYQEGE